MVGEFRKQTNISLAPIIGGNKTFINEDRKIISKQEENIQIIWSDGDVWKKSKIVTVHFNKYAMALEVFFESAGETNYFRYLKNFEKVFLCSNKQPLKMSLWTS